MKAEESLRELAAGLRSAAGSCASDEPMEGMRRAQLLKAAGYIEIAAGELAILETLPTVNKAYSAGLDMLNEREEDDS